MNNSCRKIVLEALAGKEVYPVPTEVMENAVYPALERELCRHFGLEPADHEGLLNKLNSHLRWGKPAYAGPPLEEARIQPPSTFPARKATRNIWGGWAGMNTYSDEFARPLSSIQSVERTRRGGEIA